MTGLEALENIAITFDEMGMMPTTVSNNKNNCFMDWFKNNYNIIKNELEESEKMQMKLKCLINILDLLSESFGYERSDN